MNHRPTKRKKYDAMPLEIQIVELSNHDSVDPFQLGEDYLDLDFDELTASPVCNSEFKASLVTVGRHDRIATVDNSRGRPGKSAEDDARRECDSKNVEQCFNRYQSVGSDSDRNDVPITDCGEAVDAEKKRAIKRLPRKAPGAGLKCIWPAKKKYESKQRIDGYIGRRDESKEPRPRNCEQPVIQA